MIKAYASMIREISGEDKNKRDAHAQIIIDESDRRFDAVPVDFFQILEPTRNLVNFFGEIEHRTLALGKPRAQFRKIEQIGDERREAIAFVDDDLLFRNTNRVSVGCPS